MNSALSNLLECDVQGSDASESLDHLADSPSSFTTSESQLACCWTEKSPDGIEMALGGLLVLSGTGAIAVAVHLFLKSTPDSSGGWVFGTLGALLLLGGACVLLYRQVVGNEALEVTASGIELVRKRSARKLLWSEINKIVTLQFVAHRFADMQLVVTIEPVTGRPIRFDTAYSGDPHGVLYYLTTHCDYVVRNPIAYTRRTQ